ncbi:MAG TPA: FtsW/RodA/SpoVE family cell cycle protein [Sedimentisphaerales bacterium]|nr:FtsW/RodA/SpoVE family cell cycle protein [Sedimentisphaerales bacterium]
MFKFLTGRLLIVRIILLLAALALVGIGIAAIYAVGNPDQPSTAGDSDELAGLWQRQIQYAAAAVIGFLAVNFINYRRFGAASYAMYAAILGLLVVLLLDNFVDIPFVPVINGTRRWIRLGLAGRQVSIQPSEFCKLIYLTALAWYLRYRSNYRNFRALIGPFVLTLVPMMLILAEPDLGTVLLMMPILFTMLFVAGAKARHLLIIIVMACVTSPLMWYVMKPYQRARISAVILQSARVRAVAQEHPKITTALLGRTFSEKQWENHWGYHLIRSKFAVASGGTSGYGFRKGPFVKYNFLPARHNDFIFAVIAHQWGFWGCLAVLALYIIIVACGLEIAVSNTDPFGRLLATGIAAMFAVEVLVNVSMTLGLMPITGLTLPLVSYGGSSLVVSMASVGLLNNIGRCRPFTVARRI